MTASSKRDLREIFRPRYQRARGTAARGRILDEFCALTAYHRKYAIALLGRPHVPPAKRSTRIPRLRVYDATLERVVVSIWEAAGYPWSLRLKASFPLWVPWATQRFAIDARTASLLEAISPRTIDRLLRSYKHAIKRRRFGRTKPGTLLKHHIPIKTDSWDVTEPGYTEIDCVAHCGNTAFGDFVNSVNLTDIHTTWTETRAVLGKSQERVCMAIDTMRKNLPFPLVGIDSDNGSEFINHHLYGYCNEKHIQFTRGRPYKKNDNAHIEQKNWTHVRKILGYARFDSVEVLDAINDLYDNELRLWMNFFQPTVKLIKKQRVGARILRHYDKPQTPLDRVIASPLVDQAIKVALGAQRALLDPFALSQSIDEKIDRIRALVAKQPAAKIVAHGYPPGFAKPHPTSIRPGPLG